MAKSTPKDIDKSDAQATRSVYADFAIWNDKKKPSWHPIKKMRYVFFRMIAGCTITDALKEIKWNPSEFWHLIDQKKNDPFFQEYKRAKKLQGRALADSVMVISEGRDKISKKSVTKLQKLIKKYLARASRQKSPLAAKAVIESLLAKLDENDTKVIARNKIQIDAAKWMAKAVNPGEFSEKSSVALGGMPPEDDEPERPIIIQFVGPDGSVVEP